MGDKWSDPAHIGTEGLHKFQILCQCLRCLVRRAYHESASHLIAQTFQIHQTVHPVVKRHFRWMKLFVMLCISCLVTQKIAVCTGFP